MTQPLTNTPEEAAEIRAVQSALIQRCIARKAQGEHMGDPHEGMFYALDEAVDLQLTLERARIFLETASRRLVQSDDQALRIKIEEFLEETD